MNEAFPEQKVIAGRNAVAAALSSDEELDAIYVTPGTPKRLVDMARERGLAVKNATNAKLDKLCGGVTHQGVALTGSCAKYASLEDILEASSKKGTSPFIIICDEIEDPHNLGAIIRTAEICGADGVIVPKRRSASLSATVYKTSAGAASLLPVARVPNIAAVIKQLKESGVWIYGADMNGSDYASVDFSGAVAIVIGSEGRGMGRLVRESCDCLVSLPMNGQTSSLNASVAAGVLMYEVLRRRRK